MIARLVYDGGDEVRIPPEAGTPRDDQMQGTPLEQLCELAGKLCYDSLGKGRNSQDYHAHIAEVGHTSVHEHGVVTVRFNIYDHMYALLACLNRKGVYVCFSSDKRGVDITANLRAINEWGQYTTPVNWKGALRTGLALRKLAHGIAPEIVEPADVDIDARVLGPDELNDHQAHVSLYLPSSRVVGEEVVRHRYSPSKRSTRYVDETDTEWVEHPLITAFYESKGTNGWLLQAKLADAKETARSAYAAAFDELYGWMVARGVDRSTARKQARGAARGYLGLALRTEMIYTASVAGWRDIIRQRLSPAADAEIRAVAASALDALRESRYADRFADLQTVPSPDGLGVVLAGGGL